MKHVSFGWSPTHAVVYMGHWSLVATIQTDKLAIEDLRVIRF